MERRRSAGDMLACGRDQGCRRIYASFQKVRDGCRGVVVVASGGARGAVLATALVSARRQTTGAASAPAASRFGHGRLSWRIADAFRRSSRRSPTGFERAVEREPGRVSHLLSAALLALNATRFDDRANKCAALTTTEQTWNSGDARCTKRFHHTPLPIAFFRSSALGTLPIC